jgi:hypothetical protein
VAKVRTHRRHASRDRRGGKPVRAHPGEPGFELLHRRVGNVSTTRGGEGLQVAAIRIHGARRPAGLECEQEALDIGVGSTHGARTGSAGGRPLLRAAFALAAVAVACAAAPGIASASQLIARNTSTERLAVSADGKALLTYHGQGRLQRVLAWGATNAREPTQVVEQTAFRVDYSGGWRTFGRAAWKGFRNACGPYRGPALPFLVTACTARDGSHWAVQRWRRSQANFGLPPWKNGHGAWELRLSHWSGPLAKLEVWLDWSYNGRWHHLFGRLTYRGLPVHGFSTTPSGDPLDRYGRVLYLDTLDSAYGRGWYRENGFVARRPDGTFCYGFVPHTSHTGERRPAGHGVRYRLAVSGPGVTPDVQWEGAGLSSFDSADPNHVAHETAMNGLQRQLMAGSTPCRA